jgi:cell division protein FtsI (penicillin-binding protein 3)
VIPTVKPADKPSPIGAQVVAAALTTKDAGHSGMGGVSSTSPNSGAAGAAVVSPSGTPAESSPPQKLPAGGTVVLDVQEGGIEVPSFLGKNIRTAIESAQDLGLDLNAIGSGLAREQSPQAGARVAARSRVTVRFGK